MRLTILRGSMTKPRLYGVDPGVDFPAAFVQGFRTWMAPYPPELSARAEVYVNTARMRERIQRAFLSTGPGFVPRLRLITDLADTNQTNGFIRRLELAQAVRALLVRMPGIAPAEAAFSLADSLAALFEEMHGEGVDSAALETVSVGDHSAHWERSLHFLRLVQTYLDPLSTPDTQAVLRDAVLARAQAWAAAPPDHPVIVVGSTGSRGPTRVLMEAVAKLPMGAVVLPGFDFEMPAPAWRHLTEDHPQARFFDLCRAVEMSPEAVPRWSEQSPPDAKRNRLVSLALRPAPVTDRWIAEGPDLGDLRSALQGVTLVEAPGLREEAEAVAEIMREARENGLRVALITPDRDLSRRVAGALDRVQLRPDDSAGRPLSQTAPGRFLRQVGRMMQGRVTADALIALLKHPLCHAGEGRNLHLLRTRRLDIWLRHQRIGFPDAQILAGFVSQDGDADWLSWMAPVLGPLPNSAAPLAERMDGHIGLVRHMARDEAELWADSAGEMARAFWDRLRAAADHGGEMSSGDYLAMLETYLASESVRDTVEADRDLMIWGTLEARAQGADLVILGGLNEGNWPTPASPDPWLNRPMRKEIGLLLPERQIGLSAHDFQQAIGAPQVVLTRAMRDADAETVPARWLNRLINLVSGLPDQHGPEALDRVAAAGQDILRRVAKRETDFAHLPPEVTARNPRPAPAPPAEARPRRLRVTEVQTLIRDPYQIYARHVLGLKRLDSLRAEPDARDFGNAMHRALEQFAKQVPAGVAADPETYTALVQAEINAELPDPAPRILSMVRARKVAQAVLDWHAGLSALETFTEQDATWQMKNPLFELAGRADRVDLLADGTVAMFDYKTGTLPSKEQQRNFDKQLILLALMMRAGAFEKIGAHKTALAEFIKVAGEFKIVPAEIGDVDLDMHQDRLAKLLWTYLAADQGFTARRALKKDSETSDFDHLSRRGEWQVTDNAQVIAIGDRDG